MEEARAERGFQHIAYGRNLDDDGEFRPGQQAAAQHHAVAPLATAQLTKSEIRQLAREANLSLADKPASACLASRIEYGRPVTRENLSQVEQAEAALHTLGFPQVRVRHHGDLARIEIAREDLPRALSTRSPRKNYRRDQTPGLPLRHPRYRRLPIRQHERHSSSRIRD